MRLGRCPQAIRGASSGQGEDRAYPVGDARHSTSYAVKWTRADEESV